MDYSIRLIIQSALLGNVKRNMIGVLASCSKKNISVRIIFDGSISNKDIETTSVIETEIIASSPIEYNIKCTPEEFSISKSLKIKIGEIWIFRKFIRNSNFT